MKPKDTYKYGYNVLWLGSITMHEHRTRYGYKNAEPDGEGLPA